MSSGWWDVPFEGIITPRIDVDALGATSDHLVLDAKDEDIQVGIEIAFDVNYSALLKSKTSPYVARKYGFTSQDVTAGHPCPPRPHSYLNVIDTTRRMPDTGSDTGMAPGQTVRVKPEGGMNAAR